MQGRSGDEVGAYWTIEAYVQIRGAMAYWNGVDWSNCADFAALYAHKDTAESIARRLPLPPGAPTYKLIARTMI